MKEMSLLVWLTQLGLSVATPPVLMIFLAIWLRDSCGWGNWVLWVGIGLGIYMSVMSLISSLKTLSRLTADKQKEQQTPVSFNEHN